MGVLKNIAVFTGGALGEDPAFQEGASLLGKAIAEQKATLIYGGASVGLMGVLADAALAMGGSVIGILPRFLQTLEFAHQHLTELILVDSMSARKDLIIARSDAFIALPGGIGTMDELFEVYTLARLSFHTKPIGLLNIHGYYDTFLSFLDHMTDRGFLDKATCNLLCVSEDPVKLLDKMNQVEPLIPVH
ncbi:MAG: Rossman fold protein family, partial [Gammaproteobacteria bacterium]|nr:Rossman fold protein family [Gammaproteobacteria bacterium]